MIESGIYALIAPVILSAAAVVLMLQIAFWRNITVSWLICAVSLAAALVLLLAGAHNTSQNVTILLISDRYSRFFSMLILFAGLVTTMLAKDYLKFRTGENEEFYLLLLLSILGALILVSSIHLAPFLLGLELLGVALYALIAYPERGQLPLEAAVKYLILSGAASAILLFGFALVYAALGTLSFNGMGEALALMMQQNSRDHDLLILLAAAMVLTGISFKLSLVPFHMWTPDVYQGAPAPVTGFLATVSKCAIFAALMRLFVDAQLYQYRGILLGLSVLAVASMLIGNLLALKQDNLKRLLAYSSIAHLGYLLITIVVCGALKQSLLAVEAASFYLTAYVVTSLAAFALISILSSGKQLSAEFDEPDVVSIEQIRGLFWSRPVLALMLTIAMLSLAGIPMTVGFIGKFYLFSAGISGSLWILLAALVVGSGIGIYYYLRVVFVMTMKNSEEAAAGINIQAAVPGSANAAIGLSVVWLLVFAMLYLGIFPAPLINYLSGAIL